MSTDIYLPSVVLGNLASKNILVLIAGFPDNETSGWGPVLNLLVTNSNNNCKLICLCMPNLNNGSSPKPWGYDFSEVLEMIHNSINFHVPDDTMQINMVVHDWGAFLGYLYQSKYPSRVSKLVALDVGVMKSPAPKDLPRILLYQWWFAFAYFVSQAINNFLGQIIYFSFFLLPSFFLVCPHDVVHRPVKELKVHMTYMYYHFWKNFFFNRKNFLKPKFPTCPILFMYGIRKNVMFHSQAFLDRIAATPKSKYLAVEAGHWMTHDSPNLITTEILEFLDLA